MVDPAIQRLLDTVFRAPASPGAPDIAQLRAAVLAAPKLLGGEPEPVESIRDAIAPGPRGPLPLRIYRPAAPPLPCVLYAHGGGWVTGNLDSHDKLCRLLANRLKATLVAVDYHCAPEHVYPAAVDDFEAALRWVREHAQALGADRGRLAVAGDSSGATAAAALTLRLRAAREPQPVLQLLLYPALDATCSSQSYRSFASGYNLTAEQMAWYWGAYRANAACDDPGLSPLAAPDLSGLPAAIVAVAEFDVLRDDGVAYCERLAAAGVPAKLIRCDGMIHGFLRWTGAVPAAHTWLDTIAAAARERLSAAQ